MNRDQWKIRAAELAPRGFDLPQTKVPPLAVVAIREAARARDKLRREISDKYSNEALARQWGVHVRTIEKIISYETARHIP